MRNKKGFTLVELVIVIAVIAILAGVMIGTFASVVKNAKASAEAQELAAQRTEQTANDVIEKLNNSNWLGWEDFEDKLAERLTKAYQEGSKKEVPVDALQDAVKGAMAAYYANAQIENTGLTEAQVKKIVEDAFSKTSFTGVTESQVKTIVNSATSGLSTLSKAQVQAIVDAASSKNLTLAQVTKAIADATAGLATTADVKTINETNEKIVAAVETINKKTSTLTAADIEQIMKSVTWQGGGVTTWFDASSYDTAKEYKLTSAEEVVGLATLVNGGYSFENKTIVLNAGAEETTITLNETKTDGSGSTTTVNNWTPIGNTRGNEFKGTISGGTNGVVIDGLTLDEQFNAVKNGYLIDCSSTGKMDKVGIGFVAYLGEGATLENIKFKNVSIKITNSVLDGLNVGVAVGYLDGGTIKNVTVESGSVQSCFYTAGLVGAASNGTIEDCTVSNLTVETNGNGCPTAENETNKASHYVAAGLIATLRNFADSKDVGNIVVKNVKLENVKVEAVCADGSPGYVGSFAGKMSNNKVNVNTKELETVKADTGTMVKAEQQIEGFTVTPATGS